MTVYTKGETKYSSEYVELIFAKAKLIIENGFKENTENDYVLLDYNSFIGVLSILGIALEKHKEDPQGYFQTFLAVEAMVEALEESLEASENTLLH